MKRIVCVVCVASVVMMSAYLAEAQVANDDLNVTLQLNNEVSVELDSEVSVLVAKDLDFGSFILDGTPAKIDTQGQIEVNVPTGMAYNIGFGGGKNLTGDSVRQLTNGTDFLPYNLFAVIESRSLLGSAGVLSDNSFNAFGGILGTGNGLPQIHHIGADVHWNGWERAGTYVDRVLVTIEW